MVTVDQLARARFRGDLEVIRVCVKSQIDRCDPREEPMRISRLETLLRWTRERHPIDLVRRRSVNVTIHEFWSWEHTRFDPPGP